MRIRLTLQPDQDGAKQLREQYGDRLVCVRYRYDEAKKARGKTGELIIEKSDWGPMAVHWQADTRVALQIAVQEREVRQRVKAAGGKGNPNEAVWELPYGRVVALGLTNRIVSKANPCAQNEHLRIDGGEKMRPSTNR
jgi:hypothetical protein